MHSSVVRRLIYFVAWCLCAVSAGCGSTVATSTGPSPAKCAVTLTALAASIAAGGATTTVAVSTQPECNWNASSEANWITALTPASGQGTGNVQMKVDANPNASSRQGNILVNAVRVQISQDAAPCLFDVSSSEQSLGASGGSVTIRVTTAAGCPWTSQSTDSWAVISAGASGSGPGGVTVTIASNDGGARTASIVIADHTVRIVQETRVAIPPAAGTPPPVDVPPPTASCTYGVAPLRLSAPASGSISSSVSLTAPDGCDWSASSSALWISITGADSGTGSVRMALSIASNSGAARTGTLSIAGQVVTVTQAGCAASVNPTSVSVPITGVTNSPITVSAPGCNWTATSNATWISIVSGGSGSGDGSVIFKVPANTSLARTGTLMVAGNTVNVAQAGCTYTLSQESISASASGVSSSPISVMTATGCEWSVTSNTSWIAVASGSSGIGDGTFSYSIASNNTGPARYGILTVTGHTVTVTQAECVYAIGPTSLTIDSSGASEQPVTVTTTSGCTWTAVSNAAWITVTNGSTRKGNGTVTITVAENTTGAARTGTMTIAALTFSVTQKK